MKERFQAEGEHLIGREELLVEGKHLIGREELHYFTVSIRTLYPLSLRLCTVLNLSILERNIPRLERSRKILRP